VLSNSRREQGEFEFLRQLIERLPTGRGVVVGPGHDAARVRTNGKDWLITVDSQVEGVHFERSWLSLAALGRRSFRVAASDVAAMGGSARFALLDCGVPEYLSLPALRRMELALVEEARAWGAYVVGGNLHRSLEVAVSVTVLAEAPRNRVHRSGARPGELVVVTGNLGDAGLCVCLLRARQRCPRALLRRWQLPPRRDRLGRALVERQCVSAMIDVSDGLVQDLHHICEASGVGAEVDAGSIPRSKAYQRLAAEDLTLALSGGEDYELLFTVPPKRLETVQQLARREDVPVTVIGRIVRGNRVTVKQGSRELELERLGFDHFAR